MSSSVVLYISSMKLKLIAYIGQLIRCLFSVDDTTLLENSQKYHEFCEADFCSIQSSVDIQSGDIKYSFEIIY